MNKPDSLDGIYKGMVSLTNSVLKRHGIALSGSLVQDFQSAMDLEEIEIEEAKMRRIAHEEERARAEFNQQKEEAVYFTSPEFREDVIAELIKEGCTRLQAEGRTRDQARLFAEAQRLDLM